MVALVLAAAVPAPAAAAAQPEIGGFVGGVPGRGGGSFAAPVDVAAYVAAAPGDDKIYVLEGLPGNNRVQRLDSDGNFELAWGRDVVRPGRPGDRGRGFEVCRLARACAPGLAGGRIGELAAPIGVAVDPASGDVYVFDGGNGRVQRYTADGRAVSDWSVHGGGTALPRRLGAIAVAPEAPHHVFVGDPATNRVLQLDAGRGVVNVWGWGVADGSPTFQVCDRGLACRIGQPPPTGGGSLPPSWPEHLAVGRGGVVYGSVLLGTQFETRHTRTQVVRFDAGAELDSPNARAALLPALRPENPYRPPPLGAPPPVLTNGATEGLDVDPATGDLLLVNNPFGVSKLDVVHDPAAARGDRPPLAVSVVETLPFLQNVTGLAAGRRGSPILLASGSLEPEFGPSSFTGCARPGRVQDCHGLIALASARPPQVLLAGHLGTGNEVLVDADGAATVRLEVSDDGRRWSSVGPSRSVLGSAFEPVPVAPPAGLEQGRLYRVRAVVSKRTEDGLRSQVSTAGVLLAP